MIAGDVSVDGLGLDDDGRALFATCTTVIHSAARVSFDSPLDAAVEVNLVGPLRVLEEVEAAAVTTGNPPAHLVTVSTAYVAGSRRGLSPEAPLSETPFSTEVDWRNEVAAARRTRADADAESRRPELLARFTKEARDELGAAGPPCWRPRRRSGGRRGCRTGWSRPAASGPRPWAGPTPTPTPRPWPSGPSTRPRATWR